MNKVTYELRDKDGKHQYSMYDGGVWVEHKGLFHSGYGNILDSLIKDMFIETASFEALNKMVGLSEQLKK